MIWLGRACAQLEVAARGRETQTDKLKALLAERVAKEERRLARDKQVYTRLRAAYAGARTADGTPSKGAAGQRAETSRTPSFWLLCCMQ